MPTFLRAIQLHTFEYGVPERCYSDMGTQIVARGNLITDFCKDVDTQTYFRANGIQFMQFYKGCKELGSIVEIYVKMVKRLLYGAVRNTVLTYSDFEFLVCHTVHLVNRRRICFKKTLRDTSGNSDVSDPITPEMLIRGYELVSINLIPGLQPLVDEGNVLGTGDHLSYISDSWEKLRSVRKKTW